MSYLALIDKTFHKFWQNLEKTNKIIELSTQEIIDKYQGLEGELKNIFFIAEDNSNIEIIMNSCLEIRNQQKWNILFITEDNKIPDLIKQRFVFMGYDYGIFEEEMDSLYSSIFNEILFGNVKELIFFKIMLNDFFLFHNKQEIENYVRIHHLLLKEGKNVEHEDYMKIFQIWRL